MRNQLTFCSALFIALFVGKIGHVGTLGTLSWLAVFAPLFLDTVEDTFTQSGLRARWVAALYVRLLKIKLWIIEKRVKK